MKEFVFPKEECCDEEDSNKDAVIVSNTLFELETLKSRMLRIIGICMLIRY